MLRAFVKNSFITLEGPEETILRREVAAASGRARSLGPDSTPKKLSEHEEMLLGRLNLLLESTPGTAQELLVGQPVDQPTEQPSPKPVEQAQLIRLAAPVAMAARGSLKETVVSSAEDAASEGAGAPTVSELRRLQRKLSELAGAGAKLSSGKRSLAQQRVLSNSSVSTMVSECEDGLAKSPIQKVWSSGSVSTMVSDYWDDHEEGGVGFGPIFEEEGSGSSARSGGLAQDLSGPKFYPAGRFPEDLEGCESDPMAASSSEAAPLQRPMQRDFCHPRVPKSLNLAEEFSRTGTEAPPTTMMIRNIPNRYTQRELIKEIESLGFTGTFDFLYLPIDKGTLCNVGYAFVNFVDHTWAERCKHVFENYHFKKNRKVRGKIASVSVAHIQGLEANVRHYEGSAVTGGPAGPTSRFRQRGPVIMASIEKSLQ